MNVQPSAQIPFAVLPEGTVTFLFTDIEGSTQLLDSLRERYADLLADHHRLLREVFAHWHGHEVDTQGDSFFVAFSRATQAVNAAVEAQRKLRDHSWPEGAAVRVRIGIHTGEPWSAEEGYVGMDVHRASRIANVGHGGQVLLSETAAALAQDELPQGVSTLDLGRHLLKDLNRPEHICQLVIEGLPSEFPPLNSLEALPPASARPPRKVGACPYRGLAAFQEPDAPFYFGREAFSDRLYQAVHTQPMVAVIVGSSGSGKSSAVFAGLLPPLREEGGWQITTFRPGSQPFQALASAILPMVLPEISGTERLVEGEKLAGALGSGELSLFSVIGESQKASSESRLLLVIDQFEELFTLCPQVETRRGFLDSLMGAIESARGLRDPPLVLLLTMRADFMGQALAHRPFADALDEAALIMGPMNREELRLAIEKPAEIQGAAFEPGLVERLLDDVGQEPGNLPLLEFALTLLWERQADGWLTHTDYEAMVCVEGALATYADLAFAGLEAGEQERARQVFVQLVRPGEGTEDTRRMATKAEVGEGNWDLVKHLADKRLVVTGRDAEGHETVEVVHEALIQKWGRFQEWMSADRAFRSWQERLRENLRQWQESGKDDGALLRGAPLAVAQGWLAEREQNLNEVEAGYIRESQALQARMQKELQRRRQRTLAGLAIGLVLALALAAVALFQRQNSLIQAATLLASQAESEFANGYHDRGVLLALEALEKYPYTSQAEHALGQAVSYSRALKLCSGQANDITSLAWSPDGKRLATTSSLENRLRILDAATCQELLVIDLPKGITGNKFDMGLSVRWTPDSERLVTMTGDRYTLGSQDYNLITWDAASGEKLSNVNIPNLEVPESGDKTYTVTHYPTGGAIDINNSDGRLATLGGDNSAIIWDNKYQTSQLTLVGHTSDVNSVAWSPDGSQLVTASLDGTARTWDGLTGNALFVLQGHTGRVNQALWSPDGITIATAGEDGTVRLWDATKGDLLRTIETNTGIAWSLAWSPDSARLITGHEDASLRIWDASSGKLLEMLRGHEGFITHLSWSPVDQRLSSADSMGRLRIWNAAPSTAHLSMPYKNAGGFFDISHDGHYAVILTGSSYSPFEDCQFAIWDLWTGIPVIDQLTPELPKWWLKALFAPDDRKILADGQDQPGFDVSGEEMAYVLDARTGKVLKQFTIDGKNMAWRSDWSPDGSQIALGGFDNTELVILDYETGKQIFHKKYNDPTMMWNNVDWLDYSPDGSKLAEAPSDDTVNIWDTSNWTVLFKLIGHESPTIVNIVVWSPDGTRLLTGAGMEDIGAKDNTARIWDGKNGKQLLVISGHTRMIFTADWSPDSSRVVTASSDNTTRIWDAASGAELLTLTIPVEYFNFVRWSPDGQHLLTGGLRASPAVWRVWQSKEELIEYARQNYVIRELTPEELKQFGLE